MEGEIVVKKCTAYMLCLLFLMCTVLCACGKSNETIDIESLSLKTDVADLMSDECQKYFEDRFVKLYTEFDRWKSANVQFNLVESDTTMEMEFITSLWEAFPDKEKDADQRNYYGDLSLLMTSIDTDMAGYNFLSAGAAVSKQTRQEYEEKIQNNIDEIISSYFS